MCKPDVLRAKNLKAEGGVSHTISQSLVAPEAYLSNEHASLDTQGEYLVVDQNKPFRCHESRLLTCFNTVGLTLEKL